LITFTGFTWMFIIYGSVLILWAGMSLRKRTVWKLG
jgi:hypothetical protein